MASRPVLVSGRWRSSAGTQNIHAINPATAEPLADEYPVSPWQEIDSAIQAAAEAFRQLDGTGDHRIADFLEHYATNIEAAAGALVEMAHTETALPVSPRLKDAELPRTTGQLRQAAAASRNGSWSLPTIDKAANIRSVLEPMGPVVVMGPNNFPFAFNSIAGGDFAAAVAAGCPVIAKGHPSHPGTTRLLAEAAQSALESSGLPAGFVQLLYHMAPADGLKLVSDPRIAAGAFTGSRSGGLKLKAAADATGRAFYAEMSSINPVVFLTGALSERGDKLAEEFTASCLMGTGQFCTNPGLVLLPDNDAGRAFAAAVKERFEKASAGTLLADAVQTGFLNAVQTLQKAGAKLLTGGQAGGKPGYCVQNTLLSVTAAKFLSDPHTFQTEAFGNGSLLVLAKDTAEMVDVLDRLEGNLTGCIYSDTAGRDDAEYGRVASALRPKVGRLLNDKMPTGVAVSPAMNHGGPFPATGHSGFTAVGIPAAMRRFGKLTCYDAVRQDRLPEILRDDYTGPATRATY